MAYPKADFAAIGKGGKKMIDPGIVIQVRDLKKNYPVAKGYRELFLHPFKKKSVSALNGIDLDVKSSECFCLLGPNGAGKTTLIKILSTLVLPNVGKAFVNGFDVEKDPQKIKASIGFAISEERSFSWRLTGRQNLEFYAVLNNIPRSQIKNKIEEVLELINLKEVIDLRFNTYSTGMRQMMAFARALLTDSRIIFVDEPTRSLDPQSARRIQRFLKQDLVKTQGRTVFWATHNLAEAQEYADRLAIIQKGKLEVVGSVRELTNGGEISLQEIYDRYVQGNPMGALK